MRAKERELANLKIALTPAEEKYQAKWKSEAVLVVTSSPEWAFKDDTQKNALITDAKADPGKYIPSPDTHPSVQALHVIYETAKAPYDTKE